MLTRTVSKRFCAFLYPSLMSKRILVVDDQGSMRLMLKEYLVEHGFEVETCANGREALFVARQFKPDLILLDIMMPELDGLEFMRYYRKEENTPIILLTAKLDETDKVIGLDLGADDYVTKPASLGELLARIKANLRRSEIGQEQPAMLSVSDIDLNLEERRLEVRGREVKLTPTEFELISIMMSAPGRVYSRLQLIEQLHDIDIECAERTVDVHIRNLRSKIEPDPGHPIYIESIYGAGYRFAKP